MTKDTWGAMSKTWVVGEIGLRFNRLGSQTCGGVSGAPAKTQLTMMTIFVAPKAVGLDFHVISPPSNQTQYLDIGLQFGAGFEYRMWKAFNLGMDARYHLTANMTNTNNSYFQVGPYVGISF
jgi:hypothetical protein